MGRGGNRRPVRRDRPCREAADASWRCQPETVAGLTAAQFAYQTGSGLIGAGLVGFVAAIAAFGILAFLFDTLRPPILPLIVALVFAAPAAVAGYALIHGVTKESVPSEVWRQIFCVVDGAFVGVSALLRLAGGMVQPPC